MHLRHNKGNRNVLPLYDMLWTPDLPLCFFFFIKFNTIIRLRLHKVKPVKILVKQSLMPWRVLRANKTTVKRVLLKGFSSVRPTGEMLSCFVQHEVLASLPNISFTWTDGTVCSVKDANIRTAGQFVRFKASGKRFDGDKCSQLILESKYFGVVFDIMITVFWLWFCTV